MKELVGTEMFRDMRFAYVQAKINTQIKLDNQVNVIRSLHNKIDELKHRLTYEVDIIDGAAKDEIGILQKKLSIYDSNCRNFNEIISRLNLQLKECDCK